MSDLDPRRPFNQGEHIALLLASDGKCTKCGVELQRGWHADHIIPHSKGGPTDVINGQALCPACNLKKGATMIRLRDWQSEVLADYLSRKQRDYVMVVSPAGGKTIASLAIAQRLLADGVIDRIVIVVPSVNLCDQWVRSAHRNFNIDLDNFKNDAHQLAADMVGAAVTIQSVHAAPLLYRRMITDRTLVILDEVHHSGKDKSWGEAIGVACEHAGRRLLLSGTLFRSDDMEISFVTYDRQTDGSRVSRPDFRRTYGDTLREGITRFVVFKAQEGVGQWRNCGKLLSSNLDTIDDRDARTTLRTVLEPEGQWMRSVLIKADQELTQQRLSMPDAGGLVIAYDQELAASYMRMLHQITGDPSQVSIAISDESDSAQVIQRFANGNTRWLVAVKMVSEGVDIPRLLVGVYATRQKTRMCFQQAVGRFIRRRTLANGDVDDATAIVFIPAVRELLQWGREMEQDQEHVIREKPTCGNGGGGNQGSLDLIEPVNSSESVDHSSIYAGQDFSTQELNHANAYKHLLPPNTQLAQIAAVVRAIGATATMPAPVPVALPIIPVEPLTAQKKTIKKRINQKVKLYAARSDIPYGIVWTELYEACGGQKVATATLANLENLEREIDLRLGIL